MSIKTQTHRYLVFANLRWTTKKIINKKKVCAGRTDLFRSNDASLGPPSRLPPKYISHPRVNFICIHTHTTTHTNTHTHLNIPHIITHNYDELMVYSCAHTHTHEYTQAIQTAVCVEGIISYMEPAVYQSIVRLVLFCYSYAFELIRIHSVPFAVFTIKWDLISCKFSVVKYYGIQNHGERNWWSSSSELSLSTPQSI